MKTMDIIKRIFGIIWILLALFSGYFLVTFGGPKLISGTQEGVVFGIIILFILLPIIVTGLALFGYFSLIGEYSEKKILQN